MIRTDILQNMQSDQQLLLKNQNILFETMRFAIKSSEEYKKTIQDFDESLANLLETMPDLEKLEMRVAELEQTVKKFEAAIVSTEETQAYVIEAQRKSIEQLSEEMNSEEILDKLERLEKSNRKLSQRVVEVERKSAAIEKYLSALDVLMQTVADNIKQEAESDGTA